MDAPASGESGEGGTGQTKLGGRFRARRNSELSALERDHGAITRFEGVGDTFGGLFEGAGIAARKDIDCRVAVFRPRVNTDMRFRDYDNTGHALRAELMKRVSNNRSADAFGRIDECRLNSPQVIENIGIALTEFHQHVRP